MLTFQISGIMLKLHHTPSGAQIYGVALTIYHMAGKSVKRKGLNELRQVDKRIKLRIRELRTKKGMSQKELAARCGANAQAVYCWEIGENLPTADKLPVIAAALGVRVDQLYDPATIPQRGQ